MGTIRRRTRTERVRVTSEAVAAFNNGDAAALHRALRLPPWQASPLIAEGECPWPPGSGGHTTWADSQALRAELLRESV